MTDYHGHATLEDGTHIHLTNDEAKALWKAVKDAKAKSAAAMPETSDALAAMHRWFSRLRDLGWREAQHCPKNGTPFAVIEYGSTGIFEACYYGEWPDGRIYYCDCFIHPHGMLFKPLADLTEKERTKLDECMNREWAAQDREIASLINQST